MFDNSFNGNCKQFWKYIRAKCKDHHNISTLWWDYLRYCNKANALYILYQRKFDKYSFDEWMWQPCEFFAYYAKYYILSGWNLASIIYLKGLSLVPWCFFLYTNDISEHLNSPLWLFANGCLLYRTITTDEDTTQLQCYIDQLQEWATKWQLIRFKVTKCTIMPFTKSLSPIIFNYYKLNHLELNTSHQHSYSGISYIA